MRQIDQWALLYPGAKLPLVAALLSTAWDPDEWREGSDLLWGPAIALLSSLICRWAGWRWGRLRKGGYQGRSLVRVYCVF